MSLAFAKEMRKFARKFHGPAQMTRQSDCCELHLLAWPCGMPVFPSTRRASDWPLGPRAEMAARKSLFGPLLFARERAVSTAGAISRRTVQLRLRPRNLRVLPSGEPVRRSSIFRHRRGRIAAANRVCPRKGSCTRAIRDVGVRHSCGSPSAAPTRHHTCAAGGGVCPESSCMRECGLHRGFRHCVVI